MRSWASIIKIILVALPLAGSAQSSYGPEARERLNQDIDQIQREIDLYDGEPDSQVLLNQSTGSVNATRTYLELPDEIQEIIENRQGSNMEKYNDLVGLYNILVKISYRNYRYVSHFHAILDNAYGIVANKTAGTLENYLSNHMRQSVDNITLFKDSPEAFAFLSEAARYYPDEVLKNVLHFMKEEYAGQVVVTAAKSSPSHARQYFNSKNYVNPYLLGSSDPAIVRILEIFRRFGHESKAYLFLDIIASNEDAIKYYHTIGFFPEKLLRELIKLRSSSAALLAEYDVENELEVLALRHVRLINDMHLMKDASERFATVDSMSAEELYTLMVYSAEEIFTSTYNGIFDRFLAKLEDDDGFDFLLSLNMNRFRTFIKLAAGYNTLDRFLATMSPESETKLLRMFVNGLNTRGDNLLEAVNVADTFGSLEDSLQLRKFIEFMKEAYDVALTEGNRESEILYGLLLNILHERMPFMPEDDPLLTMAESIPDLQRVPSISLLNEEGRNFQQHFFYDDEDGIYSFETFLDAFRQKAPFYSIADSGEYVFIRSTRGNDVQIFANYPLSERQGQKRILDYFERKQIHPSVVVHRGHSYYTDITIRTISEDARIVFLGSCGGYHNLTSVIERAPLVHIISSKQIGTMLVNNPMLVAISEYIRKGEDIDWQQFWKELEASIRSNPKGYEKFQDYIPPHQNLGAIFIQAYRSLSG